MENGRLLAALSEANAKKKRKESSIQQLRAEDGSGAVGFGPSEVQRYNELNQQKEQEKEQESQDKLYSRQEKASTKTLEKIKN